MPSSRKSAAGRVVADFLDLERAGAARLIDEQDAVAGVVDAGLDIDVRQRVDAVDHVADRLRLRCPSVFRSTAPVTPLLSVIRMSPMSTPSPPLSDESSVARLTCWRSSVPLLTRRRRGVGDDAQRRGRVRWRRRRRRSRLLAVAPVVSVSTMPLRAELIAAVTPVAWSLMAATISPSVSAADKIDVRRDVVAVGDVDRRRACRAPGRRGGC